MLVRSEFAIEFGLPQDAAMIGLLRLHPSMDAQVRAPETLLVEQMDLQSGSHTEIAVQEYVDSHGNRCSRFRAPAGYPIRWLRRG